MTKEINDMLTEMIRFLQKWGMWKQKYTMILTGGKKFESSDSESDTYEGIPYVAVTQPVDSEEYAEDSERLFDLKCCLDLYYLLHPYGELTLPMDEITDEAWEDLFENSTIVEEFLNRSELNVYNVGEYTDEKFLYHALVDGSDDQYTFWDPIEYETFEEYRQIYGDAGNGTPVYTLFETYEDYKHFLAGDTSMIRNDPGLYRLLAKAVKEALIDHCSELPITEEIASKLRKEFGDIYAEHGLTYEDSSEGGALLIGRMSGT